MASGIYEIVNTANGKRYVGSAKDFAGRWKMHRYHLERESHHSRHMQSAWNLSGPDAFEFRKLLVCAPRDLILYEQIALDALAPAYNTAKVAGSCLGVKHSQETCEKQRLSKLGNQHTLGYRHGPESIAKLAASKIGNTHTKGKKRDPAAVAATAAAHRGMKRSAETCAKIAAKAVGRKRSPESIEKSASKLRGVPLKPEHAAKLIGNRHAAGRVQSPQERANRSAKLKAAWAERKAAGIPWR